MNLLLEYEHCGLWRLLSQKKLSLKEREELEEALADFIFTCGAPLQEVQLAGKLAEVHVYVKDISCEDPIERLYYISKYSVFLYQLCNLFICLRISQAS